MNAVSYILCIIGAFSLSVWIMRLIDFLEKGGKK